MSGAAAINAGHPTEGDPVMEEHYEATAQQIASDVARKQAEVDGESGDAEPAAESATIEEGVADYPLPEPTAIEPSRVLEFNDDEQRLLLDALALRRDMSPGEDLAKPYRNLYYRVATGDEYNNAVDELTRVTLRKRRLEAEVRRCNIRIEQLDPEVCEEFAAAGDRGRKHDATGCSLTMKRKVWARLDVDTAGLPKGEADQIKAAHKPLVAEALQTEEVGLGDYVKPDFNLNSISAHFREQVDAYDEEQQGLPEHKRVPRAVDSFLPDPLVGLLKLDDTPRIEVRA